MSITEDEVWDGGSTRIIRSIIAFALSKVGEREYLHHFKQQFDNGYNAIYLEELSNNDFLEFVSLMEMYFQERGFSDLGFDEASVRRAFKELFEKVEVAKKLRGL